MTINNKFLNNSLKGLIYLMPLSFAFGNTIINAFVLLVCLLGIIYYKKNILMESKLKFNGLHALFVLLILSTYYNYFFIEQNKDALKAFKYLRFLFY